MSDQDLRNPNFIEVVKRNGEFSEHYGPWRGAVLYWLSMRASRPPSAWWKVVLMTIGTGSAVLVEKFGWPWIQSLWT
ncbi:hypothetical protein [Bradyrhizobium sp. LA6.12]|uniref:hypothetical protein n=1 Tax=unclassified Bradyrhizobium TaxID=2631580 RepID=UPI0033974730